MKLIRIVSVVLAFVFSGCATVSQRTKPVESPVGRTEQLEAQKEISIPKTKNYKRKIAIARFSNETNYGRTLMSDEFLDNVGKQASDMLAVQLIKSGKFLVLERPDLERLQKEQKISETNDLIGVDALILGSVTEFGRSVGGKSGFLSRTKLQTARAKVSIRLVDQQTGHAFFSAVGAGEASTESGEVAGYGSQAAYDATLNDRAISVAISDVIDNIITTLEKRPWRTDILDIQDDNIFVSGGRLQGLKVGDMLIVMKRTKVVKSKQSGFNIELPPEKIATVKVVKLFGDNEVNEGSVCNLVSGAIDETMLKDIFVEGMER
ncbi:MAG: curli production assembly protein CsgG [Candidatus Aureabacteria bacterium]|nr:curli production assembly protein CsgG [Candidatus Auribacterota bacterium]MCK5160945.1 curli production assembly protein CsgG [Candidatus Auribacterota bacterium]